MTRWWFTAFALVMAVPVIAWLTFAEPSSLWSQLVVLTGLLASSALVCAAVLPCRLPSLSQTVGITAVLHAHRFAGIFAASMVAAHISFVIAVDPANVSLIGNMDAPPPAKAGSGAALAIAGLIILGMVRHRVRHRYLLWRLVHLGFAGGSIALAAEHVWLINNLIQDAALRGVFLGLAGIVLIVLAYRWAIRPAIGSSEYVVRGVRFENDTVCTLALQPRGRPLKFAPGQFIWLRLSRGAGAEEHPFTIASGAHRGRYTEITLRCTGEFGRTLAELEPGAAVWIDGPHGTFTVDLLPASGVAMIAGGVGITPMMSMLRTLAHRADQRPLLLLRAARRVDELLFTDELAELATTLDLTVIDVVRDPPAGWSGVVGEVTADLLNAVLPRPELRGQLYYFVCGAPVLVSGVLADLEDLDVPADRIHTEQFDLSDPEQNRTASPER